jgi:large subunit ribosomal protein L9e
MIYTFSTVLTHVSSPFTLINDSQISETQIRVQLHYGNRKNIACVRTVCSHIENMITGVTKGFRYKMRLVYSHFPIGASIDKDGAGLQISNFLGQKRKRHVKAWEGVKITASTDVKDELIFEGNSLDAVSGTCAAVKDSVLVREKDIRKFLDGIYVSEKGTIVQDD